MKLASKRDVIPLREAVAGHDQNVNYGVHQITAPSFCLVSVTAKGIDPGLEGGDSGQSSQIWVRSERCADDDSS